MRNHIVERFIGTPEGAWADRLLLLCLALCCVGLLSLHKATNTCFMLIVILASVHCLRHWSRYRVQLQGGAQRWFMCALAAPFVVVAVTQLLRMELDLRDFDADARYLVAILLLGYFMLKRINLSRLLEVCLPLALLVTLLAALSYEDVSGRWNGRYATAFVDPNVLGSYAAILSFMTLMTLDASRRSSVMLLTLKLAGLAAGLWVSLLAASRGGWLAAIAMFLLWAGLRFRHNASKALPAAFMVTVLVAATLALLPELKERALAPVQDVTTWLDGSNKVTAPGQRLSIWKLTRHLIAARPLTGWGGAGSNAEIASPAMAALADAHLIGPSGGYGGAHNDALQMMIVSGVWGLLAYGLLVCVPLVFFLRQRRLATGDARLACELGACLVVGVIVGGMTNELLSLKYLASFYSLMVAGLAAQVLLRQDALPLQKDVIS